MGRLKNLAMFDRVEDELLWDIGAIVSAKYIRDNMVLLLGLTEDTTKRLMEEDSESRASVFHSLEKWHSRIRAGCRLTWVHYWGIPLVAWDTSHIQKIIASIGDFMNVDDDVDELRRLDRVRVLIKTPWTPQIDHNVNVHIQGEIFNTHITEESTTSSDICYCRRSRYLSSLEEIDSEYNEAETQTKISQQETESFRERQLQRASRDNAKAEMSGQTPSLESTLEPETVSNDTTLLPSGPRYSKDPKDKPATQKGHVSPRPKVSEDTSTTNQGNITNNLGMTTHDRKGPMHAKGNAQKGNKTNPVDNTLRLPKKGKNEVHAASGSQSLNNMQAYESKENYTMELGFATHTPKETHSHYPRSPNKSHTGQSNSCRFYVRKRWCKKQDGPVGADCSLPQTVTNNITINPHQ